MTGSLAILCYHRVLPEAARTGEGWPYFHRGTAVSRDSFARQLEQLAKHLAIVDEATVLAWTGGHGQLERPSVWMTFDDGYTDVVEHVLPLLTTIKATASVFITTCTLTSPPRALPADRWYAALVRASRRRGVLAMDGNRWAFDLDRPEDRARLVDGPERRRCLRTSGAEQESLLSALSEALGAPVEPSSGLYLSVADLSTLARQGFSMGAHGATHAPLSALDRDGLAFELEATAQAFAQHDLPRPSALAYPDAAWSEDAERAVAARYRLGLLLGNQIARREPLRLSRFVVPDDPRWVEQFLLPALGVRA